MVTLQEIQKRLVEAIKQSGLSQTALAKKLGISQPTVSGYIKGRKMRWIRLRIYVLY